MRLLKLFFVPFLLSACDPARTLIVETSKQPGYLVHVYANSNVLPNSGDTPIKTVISVPFTDSSTHYRKLFFYGLGNWPRDAVLRLAQGIDSIIITSPSRKSVLKDKNDIESYLLKKRNGLFKSRITIKGE